MYLSPQGSSMSVYQTQETKCLIQDVNGKPQAFRRCYLKIGKLNFRQKSNHGFSKGDIEKEDNGQPGEE